MKEGQEEVAIRSGLRFPKKGFLFPSINSIWVRGLLKMASAVFTEKARKPNPNRDKNRLQKSEKN
jgi:hypothetical protein